MLPRAVAVAASFGGWLLAREAAFAGLDGDRLGAEILTGIGFVCWLVVVFSVAMINREDRVAGSVLRGKLRQQNRQIERLHAQLAELRRPVLPVHDVEREPAS